MLVGWEDIFPCGETRTLKVLTVFCGKSRCLTHMAAVSSMPASIPSCFPPPLIILTFAPAHLFTFSNPHSDTSTFPVSCSHHPPLSPSFLFCFAACLTLPTFPIPCNLPPSEFFHLHFCFNQVALQNDRIERRLLLQPSIFLHVRQPHSTLSLVLSMPACLAASCMSFNWQVLLPFTLCSLPELI